MNRKQKLKIFKIILAIFVIAIIIAYLFPIIKNISTPQGQAEFKDKISNAGFLGILMLFGIQVAQIFLIIIPR